MTAPNAGNFYTGGTTNADKQAAIQAASTQAFSNFERTSQYMYNDAVIVHGPRDMTAVQQAIAPIVWAEGVPTPVAVLTGQIFTLKADGSVVLGLPIPEAGLTATAYLCLRGTDHPDGTNHILGIAVHNACEIYTTAFANVKNGLGGVTDIEATYLIDTALVAYTDGNLYPRASYDTLPVFGLVTPKGASLNGDPKRRTGAGQYRIPILYVYPIYHIIDADAL